MARRCLWCGLSIIDKDTLESFEATQIEMDYVSGIDRLDEPMPVRLVVGPSGLEVIEMMPGTRRVLIPASSLIEAEVDDAGRLADSQDATGGRRQLVIGGINIPLPAISLAKRARRLCFLTVRYTVDFEERNAIFYGHEARGQSSIERIARTISLLIKWRKPRMNPATLVEDLP